MPPPLRTTIAACAAAAAVVLGAPAIADEAVRSMSTEIVLGPQGAAVRHVLVVRAEGRDIEHGVFFNVPRALGPIADLRAVRDGRDEGIARDGRELRLGRREVRLEPGTYTYEVSYTAAAPFLRRPDGTQRFSWSPIVDDFDLAWERGDVAVVWSGDEPVRVDGPADANAGLGRFAWSVEPGDGARDLVLTWNPGAWAPELVRTPSVNPTLRYGGPLGALLVFAACHLMWRRVGRDRPAGPLRPTLTPPAGLSAAALGYVARMTYDVRAFAAALASLVSKGALTMQRDGKRTLRLRRGAGGAGLAAGEAALLDALFDGDADAEIGPRSSRLPKAQAAHAKSLRGEHQARFWSENRGAWGAVLVLALAVIAALVAGLIAEARLYEADKIALVAALFSIAAATFAPLIYARHMSAPTDAGRRVMDEIANLKAALSAPAPLPPSDAGPERFVALLPHAVALDVEEAWAARFGADLRETAAGDARVVIDWYEDLRRQTEAATFVAAVLPAITASHGASAATSATVGASAGGW